MQREKKHIRGEENKHARTNNETAKWIHAQSLRWCIEPDLPACFGALSSIKKWKQIIYLCYKNDCRRHIAQLDPAFHQNERKSETKMKQKRWEKKLLQPLQAGE